ncbi:MAG: histidine--tRNA ligase [Chthoniobacterales bacterium]
MQLLPGFRDFYPAECARRNYILDTWRAVAKRYGFVEYDGPVLEPLELYQKKSGNEIVGQLFNFEDKGQRHVSLRPEMTPTVARMVASRERDFRKPIKWFCVPQFFRYEKQQRGRGREFYQLNADIFGETSPAADAELIALAVDSLRAFGFDENDFVVRLSSRTAWAEFFSSNGGKPEDESAFFQIVDKAERMPLEKTESLLTPLGFSAETVLGFMRSKAPSADLAPILDDLKARELDRYVEVDYAIVRGLAYYTGVVFEVFDKGKNERALAGGGRYDRLLNLISDGKSNLAAIGFAMGDVVLGNLIDDTPVAREKMSAALAAAAPVETFVIIASEERRADALKLVQQLRDAGRRVDYSLTPAKIGKQFQIAEQLGAAVAIIIGDEWPLLKVKNLTTREEKIVTRDELHLK